MPLEKRPHEPQQHPSRARPPPRQARGLRRLKGRLGVLLASCLLFAALLGAWNVDIPSLRDVLPLSRNRGSEPPVAPDTTTTTTTTEGGGGSGIKTPWNWAAIKPSRTLEWHPCPGGGGGSGGDGDGVDYYDCARLDVPMDWLDPSDDERVVLAVMRLRAARNRRNTTTTTTTGREEERDEDDNDDDYRGPVFFNPGGPGGSGTAALAGRARLLRSVVGANHDVVSWDPRGVGASAPRIDCWGTPEKRRLWDLLQQQHQEGGGGGGGGGVADSHPGVLFDMVARAAALSQACERNSNNMKPGGSLLRHSGTASHARDLLEILRQTSGGDGKLRYWGFSYGTLLGGVFASMWPDKVDRMVSDGNVDYREWHLSTHINYARDTDRVLAAFYELCAAAGPARCALHSPRGGPAAVEARLAGLLAAIRRSPIVVPAPAPAPSPAPSPSTVTTATATANANLLPLLPRVVTWSRVKQLIFRSLYQPVYMFERLASILEALERRDAGPFYDFVDSESLPPAPLCQSSSSSSSSSSGDPEMPDDDDDDSNEQQPGQGAGSQDNADAFPAVMCADKPPANVTADTAEEHYRQLLEISPATAGSHVLNHLACAGRTVRPKWRYAGPFGGKTSTPILYLANMADNITPLVSARNNSAQFPGSVVLVQNSYGHTSLSAASACTARHIHAYFQNGTLPRDGATCEPDSAPFFSPSSPDDDQQGLTAAATARRSAAAAVADGDDDDDDDEVGAAMRRLAQAEWEKPLLTKRHGV